MINNKNCNFISAVVYVHNAESRITDFLKNIITVLEENFTQSEIICVNDYSNDGSVACIKEANHFVNSTSLTILNMSSFHGLETSMNAGVQLSIGDFVFEFDSPVADFEFPLIMDVYRHSLSGYDIVSACPEAKPLPASRLFYKVFNRYANLQYKIGCETFRILSRRAINRVHSNTQTIPFRKAAYANCGLATDILNYKSSAAPSERKKIIQSDATLDSLILFTNIAYRVTVCFAVFMALIIAAYAVYALVFRLMSNPVEGWTTIILFVAFGFFGLFIILAMAIKYLQTLVNLSFKRKEYLFESIEKLQ